MAVVAAWIGRMLLTVAGQMLIRALIAVGIGFATKAAFDATGLKQHIWDWMGSAGPLVGWIGFFGVDQAITIIVSALAARAAVSAAKAYFTKSGVAAPSGGQ